MCTFEGNSSFMHIMNQAAALCLGGEQPRYKPRSIPYEKAHDRTSQIFGGGSINHRSSQPLHAPRDATRIPMSTQPQLHQLSYPVRGLINIDALSFETDTCFWPCIRKLPTLPARPLSARCLRQHVLGLPAQRPLAPPFPHLLRVPKVDEHGAPVQDHQVGRLHVSMDHSGGVQGGACLQSQRKRSSQEG